ncbi:MAG: hypothetical protein MJ091_06795 [Clostridia bacterium]|nr:hypothetical protein [Clostridia bacterium]
MQFLPNRKELYISAMRNYLFKSCLKYGIDEKAIKRCGNLKVFEMLYGKKEQVPTDILTLSSSLLGAMQIKKVLCGKYFVFNVSGKRYKMIDEDVFSYILTESINLMKENEIFLKSEKDFIKITAALGCPNDRYIRILKKQKGVILKNGRNGNTSIFLPSVTAKEGVKSAESISEMLINPFSNVNLFFESGELYFPQP